MDIGKADDGRALACLGVQAGRLLPRKEMSRTTKWEVSPNVHDASQEPS